MHWVNPGTSDSFRSRRAARDTMRLSRVINNLSNWRFGHPVVREALLLLVRIEAENPVEAGGHVELVVAHSGFVEGPD